MLRQFLLNRAKKRMGDKFLHYGTGQEITAANWKWSVDVSSLFGGLHVACGSWVVWTACTGWEAKSLNL